MSETKVGDTIYEFDRNRRVYRPDKSGPVFQKHFLPRVIHGETRMSWIIDPKWKPQKINKKTFLRNDGVYGSTRFYTKESMDDRIWCEENRSRIVREVQHAEIDILRKVDAILPPPPQSKD